MAESRGLIEEFGLDLEELKGGTPSAAKPGLAEEFDIDVEKLEKAPEGPTLGERLKSGLQSAEDLSRLARPGLITPGTTRPEVLGAAPQVIVPGSLRMKAAVEATAHDQVASELGRAQFLIERMLGDTPPTNAELGAIQSPIQRFYISEAINAQGDLAKFEALHVRLRDEIAEAKRAGEIARRAEAGYAAEIKEKTPENLGFVEQAVMTAAESAGPSLAAAAIAGVSPAAGVALGATAMGIGATGSAYLEAEKIAEQRGIELTPEHKMRFAATQGVLELVGEAVGLRIALKSGLPLFERLAKAIVGEASSEAGTALMQKADEFLEVNPDMTLAEFGYEVALSAAAGAVGGGAMATVAHGAQKLGEAVGEEAQLRKAVNELLRSDEPGLETPEQVALRVLQPTGEGDPIDTPEQRFKAELLRDPVKAAAVADELLHRPDAEGILSKTPGVLALEAYRAGDLSPEGYRTFRTSLMEVVGERLSRKSVAEVQEIEPQAREIEKRLTDFADAPSDYLPTEPEAADLDLALKIQQEVKERGFKDRREESEYVLQRARVRSQSPLVRGFLALSEEGFHYNEALDIHKTSDKRPADYLVVLAQRQAKGYYPFAGSFGDYSGSRETWEHGTWELADGAQLEVDEMPRSGYGQAMARIANRELAKKVLPTVNRWLKALAPNARVAIIDQQEARRIYPDSSARGLSGFAMITGPDEGILFVDEETDNEAQYIEVLAHEFGHFLVKHYIDKAPAKVKAALDREFGQHTRKLQKMLVQDAMRERRGPAGIELTSGERYPGTLEDNINNKFLRGYLFGKEEWVAHQMERLVTSNRLELSDIAANFFKRLKAHLKRFFDRFGSEFAPTKTFEDFIKLGSLRERQRALRQATMLEIEAQLKDYGIEQLENEETLETAHYLQKALKTIKAPASLQEGLEAGSPELREKAAAAIRRLGTIETSFFTPSEGVPLSAEEWVRNLEDAWLPGQSTNSIRDALSVRNPVTANQGMPTSRASSKVASAINGYLRYSRFRKQIDTSGYRGNLDRYNWMQKWTFSLEQWAKLNPHIESLQRYLRNTRAWARDRMAWVSRADRRLKEWRSLTNNEQKQLGRFMLDQTLEDKFFDLNDPQVALKYPLTPRAREMFQKINGDFQEFITDVEATLVAQASKRLVKNPFSAAREIARIRDRFKALKAKPYFPLSRFGKYLVSVKATQVMQIRGKTYNPGETIHLEAFDWETEQKIAYARIRGQYPTGEIKLDQVSEDGASLMGMPTLLLEALKTNPDIALTLDQKKALDEYLYKLAPGQSFVKHLIQRKGIEGYTEDVQRAYANYFFHGASHLARIKHAEALNDEVRATHVSADAIIGDSTKRRAIANYMARHFRHIMVPENDWADVRAMVSTAYLGGVMATAGINLTQLPLVTYPHLAARYGDAQALNELRKALSDSIGMYHVTKTLSKVEEEAISRWTQGQPAQPGDEKILKSWSKFSAEERQMLQGSVKEGWTDESFAMELAAMSEGSWLTRFKTTSKLGYYWRALQFYSMIPFQAAEKLNRRATAVAAFRLAKQSGSNYDQAYEAAREAVSATQFEYAKWNRAELLRGKKGLLFMFFQFQLNMLYFAFGGDKGWWRWWLLMLVAVGPFNLPFAGSLEDIIQWIGQKITGPDKRFSVEQIKREKAAELGEILGVHPDLLLHGTSRFGFGLIPFADLSGRLSMGRVPLVSSVTAIGAAPDRPTAEKLLSEDLGATPALAMRTLQWFESDPDLHRRIESGIPFTAIRQLAQMGRWYRDGGIEDRTGAKVIDFDTNDPWHLMEIAGKGLGLQPRRANEKWEQNRYRQDHANFYRLRREALMKKLDYELEKGDDASVGEVVGAIQRYNHAVPSGSLAITNDQIRASRRGRERARALTEAGTSPQRMLRDLYKQLE